MRVSNQEMALSHERIVQSSSQLLRERGVARLGVAEAMKAAGLTHGGFYRHFSSREALLAEALREGFDSFLGPFEAHFERVGSDQAREDFRTLYLSSEHAASPGVGCPVPALGADVNRESESMRSEFAAGLRRTVDLLARSLPGKPAEQRAEAIRMFVSMVGAMVVARACDQETATTVLDACRADNQQRPALEIFEEVFKRSAPSPN